MSKEEKEEEKKKEDRAHTKHTKKINLKTLMCSWLLVYPPEIILKAIQKSFKLVLAGYIPFFKLF